MMRVLLLTHRLPYAPNKGDRLRAFYLLRTLRTFAEVHLLSLVHDRDEATHTSDLKDLTTSVETVAVPRWRNLLRAVPTLATRRPLTHTLLDAPGLAAAAANTATRCQPDLVFAYGSGMARLAFLPELAGLPLVLDFVDVDTVKWRDMAAAAAWPLSSVYARERWTLGAFEKMAAARADAALVVNEREARELRALEPSADVHVVENGVDLARFVSPHPPAETPTVVFCGVMDYAPNVNGALWFTRSVWPIIRTQNPRAVLQIVGAHPTGAIRRLADEDASVTVTGSVPAVQPYVWNAAVAVAPLMTARGVQNKVLEAVAAGVPCVMTSAVGHGVPAAIQPACHVADTPALFAEAVIRLLQLTAAQRRQVASQANLTGLDWPSTLAGLHRILDTAIDRHRRGKEAA